jgi:hypothetical protein
MPGFERTKETNMRQILVIAALALIWPSMLLAQWRENDKSVPDTSWRKSEGDFGVMLIFTDKPDEFFSVWETRTPGVSVSSAELVKRGSPILGVVVFTGCSPTPQGLCDATVTYTVFKPDGTVYGGPQEGELWVGKPPPTKDEIQLSMANMGVVIEPKDPLGRYMMRAEVRDRVANKTIRLEQHFDAVEK